MSCILELGETITTGLMWQLWGKSIKMIADVNRTWHICGELNVTIVKIKVMCHNTFDLHTKEEIICQSTALS